MAHRVDIEQLNLDGPYAAPTKEQQRAEIRVAFDVARLIYRSPQLLSAARGDDRTMLMAPGLGSGDPSLAPLRQFLRRTGHDARGWGFGRNGGNVRKYVNQMTELVERAVVEAGGRPVNLVGWSLGGVVVREVARDRPELIERVATFGTPLLGPRYTVGINFFPIEEIESIEAEIAERDAHPIETPVLTIFSRNDGIVDWRTCPDRISPNAVNLEVTSRHFGLGFDPTVWLALADWFSSDATKIR